MEISAKFGQILDDLQGSYNGVWKLIDDIDGHWRGEAANDFGIEAYDVDKNWSRVLNALQGGRDGVVNIARILDAGVEQAAAVQRIQATNEDKK